MTVLITGASQGIGEAIALAFAADYGRRARIALVARSADALEAVAERCRQREAAARPFVCDVTDEQAVNAMAQAVADSVGVPDVLVNNAGHFEPGTLLETSAEMFRRQLEVNVTSAFLVTKAVLPAMLERGSGRILMMGSVASLQGYPSGAAYGAAKHALLGLARSLREETKGTGVGVTTLLPGATLTPSWDGVELPPDRLMPASDIARVVVELAGLSARTVVEEVILRPAEGDL